MKQKQIKFRRRTIIVANGSLDESFLPDIRTGSFIIGVDRAAYWLITYGIIPNLAVGDFDSVSAVEFQKIESLCPVKKYQPEKDWTDLELAVKEAVSMVVPQVRRAHQKIRVGITPHTRDFGLGSGEPRVKISGTSSHIIIYGATGVRFDHTLVAINLLEIIEKAGMVGIVKDVHNEIRLISQKTVFPKDPKYTYISIIPIGASATLSLTGFRYNVKNLIIKRNQTIGVSNEITGKKATILPHRGKILVIKSRD